MDADLSHPPEVLAGLIGELDNADVAVASRYTQGGGVDPDWSWGRRQISYWGNVGIRMILGLKVKDATAGFKGFRRKALETIRFSGRSCLPLPASRFEDCRASIRVYGSNGW
jgi:dolichol-phosphate mannosyltransferase